MLGFNTSVVFFFCGGRAGGRHCSTHNRVIGINEIIRKNIWKEERTEKKEKRFPKVVFNA